MASSACQAALKLTSNIFMLSGMMQGSGVFGQKEAARVVFQNKLVRTPIAPSRADFQLLPQPRGAIANLKPATLPDRPLRHGEIKVSFLQLQASDCCLQM